MKKTVFFITVLFACANIFAQEIQYPWTENGTVVARIKKPTSSSVPDCNLNAEANRHVGRAKEFRAAAVKAEDYRDVCKEYFFALQYAPNCPDIWYNAAYSEEMLQNYDWAILFYNDYLTLNPSDRNNIEMKIGEIEAKKEMAQNQKIQETKMNMEKWAGTWNIWRYSEMEDGYLHVTSYEYIRFYIENGNLYVQVPKSVNVYHQCGAEKNSEVPTWKVLRLSGGDYSSISLEFNVYVKKTYETCRGSSYTPDDEYTLNYKGTFKLEDENLALSEEKINGDVKYKLKRR